MAERELAEWEDSEPADSELEDSAEKSFNPSLDAENTVPIKTDVQNRYTTILNISSESLRSSVFTAVVIVKPERYLGLLPYRSGKLPVNLIASATPAHLR
jgi:hypothetical protein